MSSRVHVSEYMSLFNIFPFRQCLLTRRENAGPLSARTHSIRDYTINASEGTAFVPHCIYQTNQEMKFTNIKLSSCERSSST